MGLDGRFEPTAKPGYFKTTDGNAIVLSLKLYEFSSTDELYQKVIDPLNQQFGPNEDCYAVYETDKYIIVKCSYKECLY